MFHGADPKQTAEQQLGFDPREQRFIHVAGAEPALGVSGGTLHDGAQRGYPQRAVGPTNSKAGDGEQQPAQSLQPLIVDLSLLFQYVK